MATLLSSIETQARRHLNEPTANFWSSAELIDIINNGIKDLWRDIVDLKQEHYLTVDPTNVTLAASATTLSGVPTDVHKVYLLEPRDTTSTSSNFGLIFLPMDYNHHIFRAARMMDPIDPSNAVIYYSVQGAGSPVDAPVIRIGPKVTSAVNLTFSYVPTLTAKVASEYVPIPGEADQALVAYTVAFARAKERDDRSVDPDWITVYATEKQHILESLGLRNYQEDTVTDAFFEEYWG